MKLSSTDAAFLFRKGTRACEEDFKIDVELVEEMLKRNIRVQDIIDYLYYEGISDQDGKCRDFIEWWVARENKKNCSL